MDLLAFCRQVQDLVHIEYENNGLEPLSSIQVNRVLHRAFHANQENSFPKTLMTHRFIYQLFQEAGKKFYSPEEINQMWVDPHLEENHKYKVITPVFEYMCHLCKRASRPVEQQAVMDVMMEKVEKVSLGEDADHRNEELATYAFNSIYYNDKFLSCYLSGVAVTLGIPVNRNLAPFSQSSARVFCLKELDRIQGVNVDLAGDNRLSYANLLHWMINQSFEHFFDLSKTEEKMNAHGAESHADIRTAAWVMELIKNPYVGSVHPYAAFMVEVTLRTGIDLSNAAHLDIIEEDLLDTIIAMHTHIQGRIIPLMTSVYSFARK